MTTEHNPRRRAAPRGEKTITCARPGLLRRPDALLAMVLAVVLPLLQPLPAAEYEAGPTGALEKLIDALDRVEHVRSGLGTALVTVQSQGKEPEQTIVEFMFKGTNTRSDAYLATKGQKADFQTSWAVNAENSVVWNNMYGVVTNEPASQFYRRVGYDFHPWVFQNRNGQVCAELLRKMMQGKWNLASHLDESGVLHVTGELIEGQRQYRHTFDIDMTKGCRLSRYGIARRTSGVLDLELDWTVKWRQWGSQWYPESAVYDSRTWEGESAEVDTRPVHAGERRYRCEIRIAEFQPDAAIEDTAFTVAGLGLPQGTLVIDEVLGIKYYFGGPKLTEAQLAAALAEAEAVRPMGQEKDKTPPGTEGGPAVAEPVERLAAPAGGSSESSSRRFWLVTGVFVGAGAVVAALAMLVVRRLYGRRKASR